MALWYLYQDIQELELALNTAAEEGGLPCNFRTLEDRMRNLSQNGTIYHFRSCECSPDLRYDTFEPPDGSVCSWSVLLSLLTGFVDPRESLNAFPKDAYWCHSPYGPNMQNPEYAVFSAFTDITKIRVKIHTEMDGCNMAPWNQDQVEANSIVHLYVNRQNHFQLIVPSGLNNHHSSNNTSSTDSYHSSRDEEESIVLPRKLSF